MNIVGKIYEISEAQQITDTFKKREFVLEHTEKSLYTEYIKFEFTNDRCDILNDFKVGDAVEVSFNIKGRKWNDPDNNTKYFVTLQAWKMSLYTGDEDVNNGNDSNISEENDDDLPF